jgi:hypothetical protein
MQKQYPPLPDSFSMFLPFQFHMVGRIDDCVQLKKENLKPNLRFPFSLPDISAVLV